MTRVTIPTVANNLMTSDASDIGGVTWWWYDVIQRWRLPSPRACYPNLPVLRPRLLVLPTSNLPRILAGVASKPGAVGVWA